MKKHIIEKAKPIVSKFPEPQWDKCYVMFCPKTGEYFIDIKKAELGEIVAAALSNNKKPADAVCDLCLQTTTDINFAFRAQRNPEEFCKLADKLSNMSEKEWIVVQCGTTVVPRGLYLSKSKNK